MNLSSLVCFLGVLFFLEPSIGVHIRISGVKLDGGNLNFTSKTSCQSKNWAWRTAPEDRESRECFCCLHKHALKSFEGSFEFSEEILKSVLPGCKKCSPQAVSSLINACTNGEVRPKRGIIASEMKPLAVCILVNCLNERILPTPDSRSYQSCKAEESR